ncbi:MAG: serine protein kinase, partial [Planctomycetes bacterium]|nr:serine protein kinase [Planctomycetota bacterium]
MSELDLKQLIRESVDQRQYEAEHWDGTFDQYLALVQQDPLILRTAHQRLYDMVLSHGVEEVDVDKEKLPRYRFFSDPIEDGRDGVFGLERSLHNLMSMFKAAAHGFGPER